MGETTVVRWQLGRKLRQLRDALDIAPEVAARAAGISKPTLWRIESGKTVVKTAVVIALCRQYSAGDAATDALVALAEATGERGWWEEFVLSPWFSFFVDLESQSDSIDVWDAELIPGLLQIPAYTHAVVESAGGDVEGQIRLRMARQRRVLARLPPPRLSVVLGPGALLREVGGPRVMAQQVEHLCSLDGRDGVDIRVLPWSAGAHSAMVGPFVIMSFRGEEDPSFVYLEADVGARYVEQPHEVDHYQAMHEKIKKQAVPIGEHHANNPVA